MSYNAVIGCLGLKEIKHVCCMSPNPVILYAVNNTVSLRNGVEQLIQKAAFTNLL